MSLSLSVNLSLSFSLSLSLTPPPLCYLISLFYDSILTFSFLPTPRISLTPLPKPGTVHSLMALTPNPLLFRLQHNFFVSFSSFCLSASWDKENWLYPCCLHSMVRVCEKWLDNVGHFQLLGFGAILILCVLLGDSIVIVYPRLFNDQSRKFKCNLIKGYIWNRGEPEGRLTG